MINRLGSKVDKYGIVEARDVGEHEHLFPKRFIGSIVQREEIVSQCQVCGECYKFNKKEFLSRFK